MRQVGSLSMGEENRFHRTGSMCLIPQHAIYDYSTRRGCGHHRDAADPQHHRPHIDAEPNPIAPYGSLSKVLAGETLGKTTAWKFNNSL